MISQSSQAQDNQFLANKRNIIPGAKASLLGGAYTALSDDATGIYYNPAGMIFGPQDDFSVSANAYFEKELTYKGALNGRNFEEKSTGFFPSFIGGNFHFRWITFGWGLVTLESQTQNQNAQYTDLSIEPTEASYFNITHQQSSNYVLAGTGFSIKITNQTSLGISGFGYRRNIETSNHQMVGFNNGALLVLDSKIDTENVGALAVVGFQWRSKSLSLGISYRQYEALSNSSILTRDSMTAQENGADAEQSSISGDTSFFDEMNPTTYRLGLAYTSKIFTISSDIIYYEGVQGSDAAQQDLTPGFDFGIGSELLVASVAVRLGIFSNFSLFAEPEEGRAGQSHSIDYIGYSFGLALPKKGVENSIGIVLQDGSGIAQKVAGSGAIQDVSARSILVTLGSSYEF